MANNGNGTKALEMLYVWTEIYREMFFLLFVDDLWVQTTKG